ncbi:MAG: TIR domain-containing protein [Anaerolineaceae bacterium]|nr:TIR domain-containing protein [Anaerolineaceae bacterium]
MAHIFISYNHADTPYVETLKTALKARDFNVWFDKHIEPGDPRWFASIQNAIRTSSAVIVVMTPEAEQSLWVEKEILMAHKYERPIFPLQLGQEVFDLLINVQAIQVKPGELPDERFFERLRKAVESTEVIPTVKHKGLVYISHNTEDDLFVDRLADELQQRGIEIFVDHRDIPAGGNWSQAVREAIANSEQMIAVVSRASVKSRKRLGEWQSYIEAGREIVPVLLQDDARTFFRDAEAQTVDFSESFTHPLAQLIAVLTDRKKSAISLGTIATLFQESAGGMVATLDKRYPLLRRPDKSVGIATGNIAELLDVDVLVNSENIHLMMDRTARSVSAALNYAGARRNEKGDLVDFTVDDELTTARECLENPVDPATVIVTSAGALANNHIRHILHVVSVLTRDDMQDQEFEATTHIQLGRCVTNVLERVDMLNEALYRYGRPLKRVVFPVLGAGKGQGHFNDVAEVLVERAIEYLEYGSRHTLIEEVYFVAYMSRDKRDLERIFGRIPDLIEPVAVDPE